jgi:K+-sensing histidine kinase KdpD
MSRLTFRPSFSAFVRPRGEWWEYALVIAVIALITAGGSLLPPPYYQSIGLVYVLAMILLSLRVGRWPMLAAGLLSALTWDYFLIAPRYQFRISTVHDALLVAIYLVVALVAGQLAAEIRAQARKERIREESEKLTRTLLDSVSHELRTPLAVITAALDNFDDAPAPVKVGLAGEMRTATRRLNRLVRNLLDQTRLESGTLQPRMEWCDARDLVNAAVEGLADALAGRAFTVTIPDDLPPVLADFALTEHALSNLLLNAAVHTPPRTPVHLSAGLAEGGQRVFFTVTDRGPGLPPRMRDRLYQKFERGNSSKSGGLGLGLSIVRGFVTAQGGEIVARDNSGQGCSFTIYLPHSTPQPERE